MLWLGLIALALWLAHRYAKDHPAVAEWCKWTLRFAIGSCVGALVTLAIYNNVVPS
jgi:hypothetical protein